MKACFKVETDLQGWDTRQPSWLRSSSSQWQEHSRLVSCWWCMKHISRCVEFSSASPVICKMCFNTIIRSFVCSPCRLCTTWWSWLALGSYGCGRRCWCGTHPWCVAQGHSSRWWLALKWRQPSDFPVWWPWEVPWEGADFHFTACPRMQYATHGQRGASFLFVTASPATLRWINFFLTGVVEIWHS